MKIKLLLLLGIACLVSSKKTYEGYKVFRIHPRTDIQRNILGSLEDDVNLDFWSDGKHPDIPVDIMVNPQHQDKFLNQMRAVGLDVEVFIENVAEKMKTETIASTRNMQWDAYYNLEAINSWLDELAEQNPDKVSIQIGGSTYEGREIKGVKVSFGSGRKAVMLEGGIHAREWISPATLTYIINELLTNTDARFRKVADNFDWYIFPVINGDGYAYTFTKDRFWRKTRTPYSILCKGADPNRNWNVHWGEEGTGKLCLSEAYGGPHAFSEKCTETLSNYIRTVAPNMVAYLAFHSYSQLLMVPYGHTTDHLDNYDDTVFIGNQMAKALASIYGTKYIVGNVAEVIYPASGTSIDWVKQEFQTPLVYVYELRDTGRHGFLLPPEQIIPNSIEVVESIVTMFEEADKMGIVELM